MPETIGQNNHLDQYFQQLKIRFIGFAGSWLLRTIRASLSFQIIDPHNHLKEAETSPVIAVFWHAQQLMMPWLYKQYSPAEKKLPLYVLISRSPDGRFIADAVKRLGVDSVAGSSSRGGTDALLKLNRLLAEGCHVAITPDGPRGPPLKVKCGAINLAIISRKPILPCALAATRYWTFGSWDKMILPKPFSKAVIYVGDKLLLPQDCPESELEKWQTELESALNNATNKAREQLK